MSRLLHLARSLTPSFNYGLLYNFYATQEQAQVEYGYLYNWFAATNVNNIAASGWHVPTTTERGSLYTYLGGVSSVGGKLKETGTTHWVPNIDATNEVGFNGRGSGERTEGGVYNNITLTAKIMCSNQLSGTLMQGFQLVNTSGNWTNIGQDKNAGWAIRLLKDDSNLAPYIGNDGKIYPTVKIGTQVWMSADLMETKYRDGSSIPEETDNTAWAALSTGARCSYSNTESNAGTTKALAPSGWHIPTRTEYETLQTTLGGSMVAGGKLKETGATHWYSQSAGTTNETGFSAVGAGLRGNDGLYDLLTYETILGTSTFTGGWWKPLDMAYNEDYALITSSDERNGLSIRLIKDDAVDPGTLTDADGNVYPTVTIGSQVWTARNWKCTKWSDGSYIHGYEGGVYTPISDIDWAALNEAALAAYDDDINNI